MLFLHLPDHRGDQPDVARTLLRRPLVPVPAAVRVGGRRLLRIQHREALAFGQLVHPGRCGEVGCGLLAAMQHDNQRPGPGCDSGWLVEPVQQTLRRRGAFAWQGKNGFSPAAGQDWQGRRTALWLRRRLGARPGGLGRLARNWHCKLDCLDNGASRRRCADGLGQQAFKQFFALRVLRLANARKTFEPEAGETFCHGVNGVMWGISEERRVPWAGAEDRVIFSY